MSTDKAYVHVSSPRRKIKSQHVDSTKSLKCVNVWKNSNILEQQEEFKTAYTKQLRVDLSSDNHLSSSLLFKVISLVPSLFLILTSFYLLTVGVVGYCCTVSHSDTTHTHTHTHTHTQTHHSRQDSSGRVITPTQRSVPDNTQHSQETNIHALSGIRTHNSRKQASVDPRLRPRGHRFGLKSTHK